MSRRPRAKKETKGTRQGGGSTANANERHLHMHPPSSPPLTKTKGRQRKEGEGVGGKGALRVPKDNISHLRGVRGAQYVRITNPKTFPLSPLAPPVIGPTPRGAGKPWGGGS